MNQLIAITGLAHSGKDTAASALTERGYTRLAFADSLKIAVAFIANEQTALYHDDVQKEVWCPTLGMSRRQALQKFGKGMRDMFGPDVWVSRLLGYWVELGKPNVVITDCRYPNEAEAVRSLGGIVIRINRPGAGLDGEAGAHESEVKLPEDLVDIEVFNDGTIGDLRAEMRKILDSLESQVG